MNGTKVLAVVIVVAGVFMCATRWWHLGIAAIIFGVFLFGSALYDEEKREGK